MARTWEQLMIEDAVDGACVFCEDECVHLSDPLEHQDTAQERSPEGR